MKTTSLALLGAVAASPLMAQEHRELGAHENGVGQLNIAFEGDRLTIELHAPGADIVGFEHHAESAEDRAKVEDAVANLARPLDLFVLPAAAECSVTEASAELVSEGHDHDEEHAEGEEYAGHEERAEKADGAEHSEFHAEYALTCANAGAIDSIEFAYFDTFPTARELEVQMASDTGAEGFEVHREAPVLDLAGRI